MIQDRGAPGPALVPLRPAVALFRSLGDPARLAIVRRLAAGPARVVDLTRALGLAQSTVSGHLACLRDCGLAAARPQGRASVWSLTQPALLAAGTATHDLALRWLAVPVGLAWATFLCWRSVQLAQQRLENYGPEIFTRLRTPAS